jgi:hypothetical protein
MTCIWGSVNFQKKRRFNFEKIALKRTIQFGSGCVVLNLFSLPARQRSVYFTSVCSSVAFFPVFFLLFLLRNSSAPLHCGNLLDVCEFETSLGFAGLGHYPQLALGFAGPQDYIRGFARFRGSSVSGLCFAKIECLCRNGKFSPKVLKLEQLKNWVCRVFEANCRETLGHEKTKNHEKKLNVPHRPALKGLEKSTSQKNRNQKVRKGI